LLLRPLPSKHTDTHISGGNKGEGEDFPGEISVSGEKSLIMHSSSFSFPRSSPSLISEWRRQPRVKKEEEGSQGGKILHRENSALEMEEKRGLFGATNYWRSTLPRRRRPRGRCIDARERDGIDLWRRRNLFAPRWSMPQGHLSSISTPIDVLMPERRGATILHAKIWLRKHARAHARQQIFLQRRRAECGEAGTRGFAHCQRYKHPSHASMG